MAKLDQNMDQYTSVKQILHPLNNEDSYKIDLFLMEIEAYRENNSKICHFSRPNL